MKRFFTSRNAPLTLLAGLAILSDRPVTAHLCELPSTLNVFVNRRVYYAIKADVSESQASTYSLFNNSEPAVASVAPIFFSSFQRGLFVITGNSAGQSIATLHWVYTPNAASGDCIVTINVLPESSAPPRTAANYPNTTHVSDPINLFTGELILQEAPDINLGGPMPLHFSRYYASGMKKDLQVVSSLGGNWSHNFDDRLSRLDDSIEVITSRGRVIQFGKAGAQWILQSSKVIPFQLTEVGSEYRLLDPTDNRISSFNSEGQLTSISDGKGNRHDIIYAGVMISSVTDGLGRQLQFSYASHNQLTAVTDGVRTVRLGYSFDALQALNAVTDVTGQIRRYTYTGTPTTGPLLLQVTEPEGNSPTVQTYDAVGRVLTQKFAPGSTNSFNYATNVTTMTDPLGNTRRYEFADASLTKVVDENGNSILYTYDGDGRRATITDRRGGVIRFNWHASSGRLSSIIYPDQTTNLWSHASVPNADGLTIWEQSQFTDSDGAVEKLTLNSLGQAIERIDAGGFRWLTSYNSKNQPLAVTNPAGAVITFSYNSDGTLASLTDPAGSRLFTYDASRRVIQEQNADGSTAMFSYDLADRLLRRTNELGGVYAYTRDRNGRVTRLADPQNYTLNFTYDTSDRLLTISDSSGVTAFNFDSRGFLADMTDPAGAVIRYKYDRVGNMTEITDPQNRVWKKIYGLEMELTAVVDPSGRTNFYQNDLMGRAIVNTNPLGHVRHFLYDKVGRDAGVAGPGVMPISHRFDPRGQTISTTIGREIEGRYNYDSVGALTNVIDPRGQSWNNQFNTFGQLIARMDPLGNTRSYQLDGRHRPVGVTFPAGLGTATIAYDGMGAVTQRKYSDGTQVDYAYDKRGWITNATGLSLSRKPAGEIIGSNGIEITRNAGEQILSITFAPGKQLQFEYTGGTELRRITDWMGGVTEFNYDTSGFPASVKRANGIISTLAIDGSGAVAAMTEGDLSSIQIQRGEDGQVFQSRRQLPVQIPKAPTTATHAFDAASQVAGFSYDALGRLTADGQRSYSWDLGGRLTGYTEAGANVKFEYDGLSRMTSRAQGNITNQFVWNYAYRNTAISIEKQNGADKRYYVHTPDGLLLYSIDATTGARTHYHYDEFGNTLFLTDDQKHVIAAYAYGPYGELLGSVGSVENRFTFQGKLGVMREGATGLYYMRARFYDSDNARFLTRDPLPILAPNALNPYQYALGSPTLYTDASGLTPTPITPKPVAPPATAPPPGPHVVTDAELKHEVRLMKNQLWDRISKSRKGMLDLSIPASFDSRYFKHHVNNMFIFRGRTMNGGELNYYFQGMYWKEMTGSRTVMLTAIFGWKALMKITNDYGGLPSGNDLFAALEGFNDTNSLGDELRDDVLTIIEGAVGAPSGALTGTVGSTSPIAPLLAPQSPVPGF